MIQHGTWLYCLQHNGKRILISIYASLLWRHNERDVTSNHQPVDCLLDRLFRRRSKKTSKFRVTGLCAGNSPGTGEFAAQRASNSENISIWWRHHVTKLFHALKACLWFILNFKTDQFIWILVEVTYSNYHLIDVYMHRRYCFCHVK